jgi:hypothetical protein
MEFTQPGSLTLLLQLPRQHLVEALSNPKVPKLRDHLSNHMQIGSFPERISHTIASVLTAVNSSMGQGQ